MLRHAVDQSFASSADFWMRQVRLEVLTGQPVLLPEIDQPYWSIHADVVCRQSLPIFHDLMLRGQTAPTIRVLDRIGLLRQLLPEIAALKGVEQPAQVHAEGDAFQHTLLVATCARPTTLAQWSALLHDIGKAGTQTRTPEGKIQFLGHDEASGQLAPQVLGRFGVEPVLAEQVVALVTNHMRARDHRRWGVKATRKFVRALGPLVDDVLDLFEADSLGSLTPEGTPAKDGVEDLRERVRTLSPAAPPAPRQVLSGDTIMEVLGCGPGPAVGSAQRWLLCQPPGLVEEQYKERLRYYAFGTGIPVGLNKNG
jgi:tRNA nucleotidyltransferase/poly(A) polymerase